MGVLLNVSTIGEGAWCVDIIATSSKPCAGLGQETLSVVLAHGGQAAHRAQRCSLNVQLVSLALIEALLFNC